MLVLIIIIPGPLKKSEEIFLSSLPSIARVIRESPVPPPPPRFLRMTAECDTGAARENLFDEISALSDVGSQPVAAAAAAAGKSLVGERTCEIKEAS